MNSPQQANGAPPSPPPAGMGVDDVLYTLFRHKWLILTFFCLGVIGACYVRITRPPNYVSHAKLKIHYLEELAPPPGTDPANIQRLQPAIAGALNGEKETIKTLNVASNVAVAIGPRRLLLGKSDDLETAAGLVCGSIDVDILPATPVMTVSFRHKDKSIVRPAVAAVIQAYLRLHSEVNSPENEEYTRQERELQQKLTETQLALDHVLLTNKLVSLEETKKYYQEQQTRWKNELRIAEVELAARRAALSDASQEAMTPGSTNSVAVPAEVAEDYSSILNDLATFKSQERQLVTIQRYTEFHPAVLTVRGEIKKLTDKKVELLTHYPGLVDMASHGTNSPVMALATDVSAIKALSGKIAREKEVLTEIEQELSRALEIEPIITDLTSQRDQYSTNLASFSKALNEARFASLSSAKTASISVIESPTPPEQDKKKLMKQIMTAFMGCVVAGLALAFLIDFFLDRSIKRTVDIERHLKLPVFLSIPDTRWSNQIHLPWANGDSTKRLAGPNGNGGGNGNGHALAHWDPVHHLQPYTEGLRERLLTYFEINNQAQKRPKLVGLTACGQGAGVTTLASGLAASLSRIGNGNVLLVDMNVEQGVARSFHHGQAGCGLTEALEPDAASRADEQVGHNLYLATVKAPGSDEAVPLPVQSFNQLMPKLNASEYDYIIFDLPPVSQTSATPRYSGYMDLVLLVLESEKTGQHPAAKASALMQESRAKVAAVLNKYRRHVPAMLAQDC